MASEEETEIEDGGQGTSGKGSDLSKKRKGDDLAAASKERRVEGAIDIAAKFRQMEARQTKIEKEMLSVKADVADGKRQYAKQCLILTGEGIPPPPKKREDENCAALYAKLCMDKYGVEINVDEMGDVHRTARGLVAQFSNRKDGSAFDRLIHRFGNWNPNPNIAISVNIFTIPYDSRIKYIANRLKQHGTICQFHTAKSGHIKIRKQKGDQWISIGDVQEIEKEIPAELRISMDQEDKERASRRREGANQRGGLRGRGRGGRGGGATGSNAVILG
jgi:hypothetical protein